MLPYLRSFAKHSFQESSLICFVLNPRDFSYFNTISWNAMKLNKFPNIAQILKQCLKMGRGVDNDHLGILNGKIQMFRHTHTHTVYSFRGFMNCLKISTTTQIRNLCFVQKDQKIHLTPELKLLKHTAGEWRTVSVNMFNCYSLIFHVELIKMNFLIVSFSFSHK